MGNRNPQDLRRQLFALWCRLYMVMAAASVGGGIYLIVTAANGGRRGNSAPDLFICGIGVMLILFGLWRGGLALYHLRRLGTKHRTA